jgi:predicted chitinase
MNFYYGVVENRDDPLKLGRCQVRIVGLHTQEKSELPTADLPWATPMQPVTSAAMNGIGWTPVGPVEGTSVIILFADTEQQQPIMIGTVGGIPQSKAASIATEESGNIITNGGVITTPNGEPVKNADGTEVNLGNMTESATNNVVTAANSAVTSLKNKVTALASQALGVDLNTILSGGSLPTPKKETLTLPLTGADNPSKPTIVPNVSQPKEQKIDAQPQPGKADDKVLNTDINLEPMPKYCVKGKEGVAKQSIAALVAACDKVGLTSKYAKAAIIGICGGESAWLPVEEGHVYNNPQSLLNTFPSVFKGDLALATAYSGGKKSKQEFFELIYGYQLPKGQGLGNKTAGDGGKYYGRGFNQLTGKAGYKQAQDELAKLGINVDLINQPNLLIDDINTAALACAIFYKVNVKHPQDDPGYFVAARARTGKDAHGGYEKKQIMYEYYLGQGVLASSTNKPAVDQQKTYTPEEVAYLPADQQKALLEDRSENASIGFRDPNGKYPLRNLINEPDTNRLARGVIKDTAIAFKDQIRSKGIPAPFGASWEQPLAPFGGRYPYNKVYETESGHLQVFDDTPGHETVSLYHKKGTSLDIDANGTQVNKIVGDGYTIIDRNGMIYIAGKCNLTVGNSVNILVQGDANIEVNGATQALFHGQVDIGCADDVNMAVGGNFNLQVNGDFNTTVNGNKTEYTAGTLQNHVVGEMSTVADANVLLQSGGAISTKAGADILFDSAAAFSAKAAGEAKLNGGSNVHIKSSATVYVDGTAFQGQSGAAHAADGVEAITGIAALSLSPPDARSAAEDSYELLQTPVRPAPPVDVKFDLNTIDDYYANPNKYYDSAADAAGVNANRPPQPDVGDKGASMAPSGAEASDIQAFLTKQLALAKEGYWSETAVKPGAPSNPNILAMWKDIGLANIGVNDQVAWCMCFVNWTLKQCNYRYFQSARAFDMRDRPEKWNATKVSDPQPGDVIVWRYSHVSFVYKVENGKIYPCGGNQGGKTGDNNPKGGTITQNYTSGIPASHPDIVGIYRPSKA